MTFVISRPIAENDAVRERRLMRAAPFAMIATLVVTQVLFANEPDAIARIALYAPVLWLATRALRFDLPFVPTAIAASAYGLGLMAFGAGLARLSAGAVGLALCLVCALALLSLRQRHLRAIRARGQSAALAPR